MDDLQGMGYTEAWRKDIIMKTITGYMRILQLQKKGKREERREKREQRKENREQRKEKR